MKSSTMKPKGVFDVYGKVTALLDRIDVDKLAKLLDAIKIEDGKVVVTVKVVLEGAKKVS